MVKKEANPLVSVIVPVYNVAEFLERCVQSIIEQTYANLEILLINDGSTDQSGELSDELAKTDDRIRVYHQANKGLSEARNTGLENIKGEYVLFVDSDDWIKPQMISKLLSYSIENDLQLVECGVLKSTFVEESPQIDFTNFIENQAEAMYRLLIETNYSVWRRIYSKELIGSQRFIPGKVSEDVFFTIDCINKIEKQGCLREPLYIYNTENESITRSPYNLKKIEAKDALYYPVAQTAMYEDKVQKRANYLLLRGLIFHYERLLLHSQLDRSGVLRKKFKDEVIVQLQKIQKFKLKKDIVLTKGLMVKYLPIAIYKFLIELNEVRLNSKR